jgi:hypothetical protein
MTRFQIVAIALAAALLSSASALAQEREQEKKIDRSDLPPAVEKAVVEQSKGATIRGFEEEKEGGQTLYEAKLMANGRKKNVLMAADGTVVEVEEEIPAESLSPAVREGLRAKAGNGEVVKVKTITKKGKLVAYEVKVMTNGKKSEIQVSPDGKPLDHEE